MIDTNILLDWLLDRDPVRTASIDMLFAGSKDLAVPDLVLVELVFALEKYYALPREIVYKNLSKVLDEPKFNCRRALFYRAINTYTQNGSLSFIDCCLLEYVNAQNTPLWTFDKKLASKSGGRAQVPK